MTDHFAALRGATAQALLHGPGTTTLELRLAVAAGDPPLELAELVQKIRTRAHTVTNDDVDTLKRRYSEDQLFEIIVAAAFGAAQARLAAALRALDDA